MQVDVAIFGGGIAGLWTLSRLTKLGYNAVLLETNALGSGQTTKSQGIIHGGLKYALSGQISQSVMALQDMPTLWQECLNGRGEIDLSSARILSKHQYMWSKDSLIGGLSTLFASQALKSHVQACAKGMWPQVMDYSSIQSKLYQLDELVLDIPSVITALATPLLDKCIKIEPNSVAIKLDSEQNITHITCKVAGFQQKIQAQKYIFTAGAGNKELINTLHNPPTMQLRPLQMVLVKSKNLLPLYGHCIGLSSVPRITITTHYAKDGIPVWYLGGKLAEDGVNRTIAQQIAQTKQELQELFPKLSLDDATYRTLFIDRAEAKQKDGSKPTTVTIFNERNYITAWPTKLALAPILANVVVETLKTESIAPSGNIIQDTNLAKPNIAQPIWDELL